MTKEEIQKYWDTKAKVLGTSLSATMQDVELRKVEIEVLLEQLRPNDIVLDVGCGNGAATALFMEKVKHIIGIDFSSEMIQQARKIAGGIPGAKERISFQQKNVLDLSSYDKNSFDTVISERCLINLKNWEEQQRAILEIKRVLKKGGIFLLVESTIQGLENLNAMRRQFNLGVIEKHWHNVFLDEVKLLDFLRQHFEIARIRKFGTYFFISRVVHPLLLAPAEPSFCSKINEVARVIASKVNNFDEISINGLYILNG